MEKEYIVDEVVVASSIFWAAYFVVFLVVDIMAWANAIQYDFLSLSIYISSIAYFVIAIALFFLIFLRFGFKNKSYLMLILAGLPFFASPIRALFMINLGVVAGISLNLIYDIIIITITSFLLYFFTKRAEERVLGFAYMSIFYLYLSALFISVFVRDIMVESGSFMAISYGSYLHYGFYDYLTSMFGVIVGIIGLKLFIRELRLRMGESKEFDELFSAFKAGDYKRVIELAPNQALKDSIELDTIVKNKILLMWGYSLYKLGEYENALKVLSTVEGADGIRGDIYLEMGRLEEAQEHYMRAIEQNPKDYTSMVNLGTIYAKYGKVEDAEDIFKRAIEINKSGVEAWGNTAVIEVMRGRYDDALALISEATKHVKG